MRREYGWRSSALAIVFGFCAFLILGQMVRIQTSAEADIFREQAELFAGNWRTYYPERGRIYDRNGHLLAGNEQVYTVGVNITEMNDAQAIALAVSANLGLDFNIVYPQLLNPDGLTFLTLKDFVTGDELAPLQEMQRQVSAQSLAGNRPSPLAGLEFQPRLQRSYPEHALASNLIGFVNREGRGYFGVEEKYNNLLAGNPVRVWVPEDPNRAAELPHVPGGTTLVLTIDRDVQSAAEESLDQALIDTGAQNGTIIIMDPASGEILAMATTPRMDLNQFWNYSAYFNNAYEFNPAISMQYEPGSVFKILTMAGALDMGLVQDRTPFFDTGSIIVGEVNIQNWDRGSWGAQDMTTCLQHSLNVCLAWVSTQMGADHFYDYMRRFGIGHTTGIDLAGEVAGRLKMPRDDDWYPVDLGTNAFGQGVAVTPIQMLAAVSAVANDGRMVTPRILNSMVRDGRQFNILPSIAGTPISAQTAHTLSQMLATSLESEASMALIPGYRVAGKTGTAQIPVNGYYDPNQTNVSFVGWGPVDDPKFLVYVWLEGPTSSPWANETAAPLFAEIVQKLVILLNIPPDFIRLQTASQ